jgi:hypothetical protein
MRQLKWTVTAALAALALIAALPRCGFADGDGDGRNQREVRLEAALTPTHADPRASGRVEFEKRSGRKDLRVDVQDITSTDVVDVFADGRFLGQIALRGGSGRLELNSQNGDHVPNLRAGERVRVLDAGDNAKVILVGTLVSHN